MPSSTLESISARNRPPSADGSISRRYARRAAGVVHARRHVRVNSFALRGGARVGGSADRAHAGPPDGPEAFSSAESAGMTKPSNGREIAACGGSRVAREARALCLRVGGAARTDSAARGLTGFRCAPATRLQKTS